MSKKKPPASKRSGKEPPSPASGPTVGSPPVQSRPLAPEPSSQSVYELGRLNRHWYRRCLDALSESLNRTGSSPSVKELNDLCDRVVTSFLTAVAGQAPDSDQLQFPADRRAARDDTPPSGPARRADRTRRRGGSFLGEQSPP